MHRALRVWDLQVIDSELERLRPELTDVEAHLGDDSELAESRQTIKQQFDAVRTLETEQRSLEWDAVELRQKIKEIEQKLYSGRVTNIKELQGMQQDDESLKRRLDRIEDRELDVIDRLETAQAELKRVRTALDEWETRWSETQARLEARRQELRSTIARREADRAAAIPLLHPADLQRYESLLGRKQGRAAAKVSRSVCGACRVELPNVLLQRVRTSDEPVACPSCERILIPA